jgi:hypothetical protein
MPISETSQKFIPIKEIRDGVVILRDKSMRMVLMVSSINFALKSEDLQRSIIMQFQNFINSLDFSVEISIQSRRTDIKPYLRLLEERYGVQTNDLLKVQIREYIKFIRDFMDNSNVMSKHFFVVVPYAETLLSQGGGDIKDKITNILPSSISGKKTKNNGDKEDSFIDQKTQLEQRVAVVEQGLIRCGLRTAPLGTEELVEFYYRLFNPGELANPAQVEK